MDRKQWMAFAGGAGVALIASRILPPVAAQGLAAMDRADPFDRLVRDHRHFRDLLDRMADSRGAGAAARGALFLRLKRGLAAHALAEEDVVYPLLADRLGARAAADRLYAEHGQMKTHLYALEHLLGHEAAWIDRVHELRALVDQHARQEEETEFPVLKDMLADRDIRHMNRHIRREKAMLL